MGGPYSDVALTVLGWLFVLLVLVFVALCVLLIGGAWGDLFGGPGKELPPASVFNISGGDTTRIDLRLAPGDSLFYEVVDGAVIFYAKEGE